jgi:F0F1-type ATP synthase assembly protein I
VDLTARRETNKGLGDGLALAFELALTPTIFGVIGYLLDRWLGIVPVLTIVLGLFAMVGMFVRMWFGYDLQMREQERLLAAKRDGVG